MTSKQESALRILIYYARKDSYFLAQTWFQYVSSMGIDPLGFELPLSYRWTDRTHGWSPVIGCGPIADLLLAFRKRLRMTQAQYGLLELEFVTLPLTEGT